MKSLCGNWFGSRCGCARSHRLGEVRGAEVVDLLTASIPGTTVGRHRPCQQPGRSSGPYGGVGCARRPRPDGVAQPAGGGDSSRVPCAGLVAVPGDRRNWRRSAQPVRLSRCCRCGTSSGDSSRARRHCADFWTSGCRDEFDCSPGAVRRSADDAAAPAHPSVALDRPVGPGCRCRRGVSACWTRSDPTHCGTGGGNSRHHGLGSAAPSPGDGTPPIRRQSLSAAFEPLAGELRAGAHPARALAVVGAEAVGAVAVAFRAVASRCELGGDVIGGLISISETSVVPGHWGRLATYWGWRSSMVCRSPHSFGQRRTILVERELSERVDKVSPAHGRRLRFWQCCRCSASRSGNCSVPDRLSCCSVPVPAVGCWSPGHTRLWRIVLVRSDNGSAERVSIAAVLLALAALFATGLVSAHGGQSGCPRGCYGVAANHVVEQIHWHRRRPWTFLRCV